MPINMPLKKKTSFVMTPMMGLVMALLLNDLMAGESIRRLLRRARPHTASSNQSAIVPDMAGGAKHHDCFCYPPVNSSNQFAIFPDIAGGAERLSADSSRSDAGRPFGGAVQGTVSTDADTKQRRGRNNWIPKSGRGLNGGLSNRRKLRGTRPTPAPGPNTVDLLIVYCPKVLNIYDGAEGIKKAAKKAVFDVNTGLLRSGAIMRLRLVGVEPVNYASVDGIGSDLHNITGRDEDLHSEVSKLRDYFRADLVTLVSDAGGGGIAWLGGGKRFGYNVIARHTIKKSGWTLGHELGHNMGCPHHTGHAFIAGEVGYFTVMSMGPGQKGILQYSNPEVRYQGIPTGTAEHNNVAIINRNASKVAAYYP